MARLYDAIGPEVISMEMLNRAVIALRADADNVIPKEDKIDYSKVETMRLDFSSENRDETLFLTLEFLSRSDILRMENLWSLKNLTKLQLDNNIIERIEGLETLQKLTWLGLCIHFSADHQSIRLFVQISRSIT